MVALPVLEVEFGDCRRLVELEAGDDEDDIDEDRVNNDELPDVEVEAATSCRAPHTFALEVAAPTDNFK